MIGRKPMEEVAMRKLIQFVRQVMEGILSQVVLVLLVNGMIMIV
ncbi:hypothetical protein ES703_69824 [subsurface metagenome]